MVRYQFIDDLIPLILDADEHWWPCHLAALATVSSAWLFYVRKQLYPCPDIRSFSAAQKLADTLKGNAYLASLVKGISLQPNVPACSFHVRRLPPTAHKAIRELLQLEDLGRLTFGGDLTSKAALYLRLIAHPEAVEEIHINGPAHARSESQALVEWDESFTFGFRNLRKLRLSHIDMIFTTANVPYPASFTHLILEDVLFFHGNILQLLNGASSLKCLHVTSSDTMEDELRRVLSSCAVDCLHYDVRKSAATNPFADLDSRHGESIRCLHLDGHCMDIGILTTLGEVFKNLEELVISGRLVRVLPREWAHFIRVGGLGSLRRLVLPWGTNEPPFAAWQGKELEEIRAACLTRSITLMESK